MVSPFGLALRSGLCFSMVPFLTSFTFVFDSGARSQRVLRASPPCHWNVIGTEHPEVPIPMGVLGGLYLSFLCSNTATIVQAVLSLVLRTPL